jgi:hypothetical protein
MDVYKETRIGNSLYQKTKRQKRRQDKQEKGKSVNVITIIMVGKRR